MGIQLLDNATVTTGQGKTVARGSYAFAVWGTSIGQGTVTLQRNLGTYDAPVWLNVGTDAIMTTFGQCRVDIPAGVYRAMITDGGTDPVGVFASLEDL